MLEYSNILEKGKAIVAHVICVSKTAAKIPGGWSKKCDSPSSPLEKADCDCNTLRKNLRLPLTADDLACAYELCLHLSHIELYQYLELVTGPSG